MRTGDAFGAGLFAGWFLSMAVWITVMVLEKKEIREEWERQCVLHGSAEYVTNEEGRTEWRWKDERK
jgi:hypothetical protein